MLEFIRELFPVCRSITGNGVRQTLARIRQEVPVDIQEIASGTAVFDWTVPEEWNIVDAYIDGPDGARLVDFKDNNLHVVNYSTAVNMELELSELCKHLHTLPETPNWIPYRTSYYDRNWGFCLTHNQYEDFRPGIYHVRIDSELKSGYLTLGELVIPGTSKEEILVYSHLCHPSLCNDNLSGLAVTVWWAKSLLSNGPDRYTYRFVWGPGTIGSITWLARNQENLHRIRHGLVAVLLGRPGIFNYKRSRQGNTEIDRAVERVLKNSGADYSIREFDPYGYDERQFCSPGINLPVGRLTRAPNGEYPEYHTSADNVDLVTPEALAESLKLCKDIGCILECADTYKNNQPNCEPQLGRRGLYRATGGENPRKREYAMLWILNMSDGEHSLIDIADRSGLSIDVLIAVASELSEAGLLQKT